MDELYACLAQIHRVVGGPKPLAKKKSQLTLEQACFQHFLDSQPWRNQRAERVDVTLDDLESVAGEAAAWSRFEG